MMTFPSPTRGLLILCHAWLAVSSPPVILGPSELTHLAGEKFNLTCVGDKPLSWSHPESEKATFEQKTVDADEGYKSILEVSDPDYLATGQYECRDEKSTAGVYVYVPDIEHLLAVRDIMVTGLQYHDVIVPCKPTAPEIIVKLTREDDVMDIKPTAYDPKIGFTLSNLTPRDSGELLCTAVKDSKEQSHEFILIINTYTNMAPKPEIDVSTIQHVVIGQEIEIPCLVEVELGTMFLLDWIFPDLEAKKTGRIVVGETTATDLQDPNHYLWEKTLKIHHANEKDEGNYTCIIKDHSNNTNSDTKYVKVYSKEDTFINLTVHSRKIEVDATRGDVARWILTLMAHPNAELSWFSPDGLKLSREVLVNDKYVMKTKNFQTSLEIHNVDISDAGNYTVVASNYGGKKTLNLELVVFDVPIVKIEYRHYYKIGVPKNVTCRVIGHPTPTIQWSFQKCDFISDQRCEKHSFEPIPCFLAPSNWHKQNWVLNPAKHFASFEMCFRSPLKMSVVGKQAKRLAGRDSSTTTELQINESQLESKLEWNMTEPGLLGCLAANEKGIGNDTTVIRVTDVPQGFHVGEIPEEIVVGDNITLSCGATSYEYKPNLLWYVQKNGSREWKLFNNTKIMTRENRSYSYWSEINFKKAEKAASGVYKCVAEKASKKPKKDERVLGLMVLEVEPPEIYDTNLTNSEVTISSWQPLTWRCAAKGVPEPTVVWYKDDEVLSLNSNFSNFELSDDNQTLLVKTLTMNEEGIYICRAQNKGGFKEVFMSLKLKEHHKTNMTLIITVVVVATLFVILVFSFIFALWKIRKEKKLLRLAGLQNFNKEMTECLNQDLTLEEQVDLLPYDPKWEFPRSKLKLGKQLGSGAFGVVVKAEAYGIMENEECTTVAVKMVKRHADAAYIRALTSELKILAHLGKHLNVVNLLGACTKNVHKRELLVIVEFCTFGNVHNYLLSHRDIFIDQIDLETDEINVGKGRMVSDYTRSRINYATLTFPRSVNSDPNSALASFDTDTTCLSSLRSGGDETFSTSSNNNPDWCANLKGDYFKSNVEMLSTSTLVCWGFQIARGMEYLASRRVLHGDLAARNVLLADNNVVKICDFGFAKSIYNNLEYRKSGDGPVPVKWMAIESVTHRIFSTQSDVWSFGIVLWELFSLARTPYPGFENFEIIHNKLIEGYRMEKPLYANQRLYDIMLECWDAQPCRRPSFSELVMKLGKHLENNVKEHYLELNEPYTKYSIPEEEDYLTMVSPPTFDRDMSKSHYVNLPSTESSSPKSEKSDYLDMTPWTPTSNGDDNIEMKPMLSEKERIEENDDYLIPRNVPSKSDCAFNPNYLVSQNKLPTDKNNSVYGKLNKVQQPPQNESKSVKENVLFFEKGNNKENKGKKTRGKDDDVVKNKKNSYLNI